MDMFCYQCEQTMKGTGCTKVGVCGKEPQVSSLMDLLLHSLKLNSRIAFELSKKGIQDKDSDVFTVRALFATITNVNFDEQRFVVYLKESKDCENKLRKLAKENGIGNLPPSDWEYNQSSPILEEQAIKFRFDDEIVQMGEVNAGLYHFVLYGLKGVAAYADHARLNGVDDKVAYGGFNEILSSLYSHNQTTDQLLDLAMAVGKLNLKVMELLNTANTKFGAPVPTKVKVTPVMGKCIMISGHDLADLNALLEQTQGTGINVYTHGEMLPAHGYPLLHKYPNLVANFGSAWQNQQTEFPEFPGPIILTTNCLMKPRPSYQDRVFTVNEVGFPGLKQIHDRDFSEVIKMAKEMPGFLSDNDEKSILVGFGKDTLISSADRIIELVKAGKLRHVFLVGGCDGAKPGRSYYTDFAQIVPKDCLIMTLACGKYRFNKLDFGDIDGLPRLIDCGQCNDSFSAVSLAIELATKLGTDVNSLPLSLVLSWYEQKAIAVLLTLLSLGIKNIKIGPTPPAPLKEPVMQALHDKFNLQLISTPQEDLKAILG